MRNKKVLSRTRKRKKIVIIIILLCSATNLLSSNSTTSSRTIVRRTYAEKKKQTSKKNVIPKNETINKHKKKKKNNINKKDLYVLSHVINGESCGSSYKDSLYVGSVVLNRVKDKRFPNTIEKVVFEKRQYACTWDGNYNKKPTKRSIKIAKYLLKHGSQLPSKVVWQAQFKQGNGVYIKVGRHYYCY